ncbi:hypothetical protein OHB41_33970 [Streptomyces sp. NBC_01571]|uniref:hypothetical protein n=1 Tax=Streptomyces sp. NBC_01571 TaxID=2975883 RepID=UPI0022517D21|nr:hypothetical protein [Streptomyces sp. NBC_01571]MCX4578110.1 hypothetical protein [Streptomyces sp. NBC_01571]
MLSAPAEAVKSALSKARSYLPFSPAKQGPFSGRGWTLYSGHSLMSNLAQGIRDRSDEPRTAMNDALTSTAAGGRVALAGAPALGQSSPIVPGGAGLVIRLETSGAEDDLHKLLRKIVRVKGRGSAEKAFGQ